MEKIYHVETIDHSRGVALVETVYVGTDANTAEEIGYSKKTEDVSVWIQIWQNGEKTYLTEL